MSSKLTPEIRTKIIENLATNPSLPSAAVRAGIAPSTLRGWLQRGEEGDERYAAFAAEVALSRATIKDSVIAALIETACDVHHPQQVRAASRILECLFPSEFASIRHTVTHKSKDPEIDLSSLSTEELRAFHRMLKSVMEGDDSNSGQKSVPVLDVVSEC